MDRHGRTLILVAGTATPDVEALADTIRRLGYAVALAERRAEAVRAVDSGRADVALVPASAAAQEGFDTIRALRETGALPIVLVAPLGDAESRRRGREAGADDALPLPASNVDIEIRLGMAAELCALRQERDEAVRRLSERDVADPATGLVSRIGFRDHLDREYARARRYVRPLALLRVRIDALAAVARRRGPEAAERAMARVAEIVRRGVREADVAARVGESDIAVLAPETGADAAAAFAERLRAEVAEQGQGAGKAITVSIGVAALPDVHTSSADRLLEAATSALRRAAKRGNGVDVAG